MTLKTTLLICIIGITLHLVLRLAGMSGSVSVLSVLDMLLFEGSVLFYLIVTYRKQ